VDNPEQVETPNAEAAKYRKQLREVQTENVALQERVDRADMADANRVVEAGFKAAGTTARFALLNAADFWALGGVGIADVMVDGSVDQDKVTEILAGLHESRPYLFAVNSIGDSYSQTIRNASTGGGHGDVGTQMAAAIRKARQG